MKNKVKITALTLALIVSMASIVGCSNNSSTSAEASLNRLQKYHLKQQVQQKVVSVAIVLLLTLLLRNAHIVMRKNINLNQLNFLIIVIIQQ